MYRALPLALLLTIGCEIQPETFIEDFAANKCANIDACGKISETHGTLDDCIEYYEIFADVNMIGEDCGLLQDQAKDCLSELKDARDECPVTDAQSPSCAKVSDCSSSSAGSDTGK
jgi:hypothetical protein